MRFLAVTLGVLILLIQAPLWLGKGSWMRVWQVEGEVTRQKARNSQLETRNAGFAAEVRDLKQGTEAIEERARYELGMVKNDEVFFQVVEKEQGKTGPGK